jgi:hypothetical protein
VLYPYQGWVRVIGCTYHVRLDVRVMRPVLLLTLVVVLSAAHSHLLLMVSMQLFNAKGLIMILKKTQIDDGWYEGELEDGVIKFKTCKCFHLAVLIKEERRDTVRKTVLFRVYKDEVVEIIDRPKEE